jgi:hypothetical protein
VAERDVPRHTLAGPGAGAAQHAAGGAGGVPHPRHHVLCHPGEPRRRWRRAKSGWTTRVAGAWWWCLLAADHRGRLAPGEAGPWLCQPPAAARHYWAGACTARPLLHHCLPSCSPGLLAARPAAPNPSSMRTERTMAAPARCTTTTAASTPSATSASGGCVRRRLGPLARLFGWLQASCWARAADGPDCLSCSCSPQPQGRPGSCRWCWALPDAARLTADSAPPPPACTQVYDRDGDGALSLWDLAAMVRDKRNMGDFFGR